jgi:hypothetical protein
MYDELAPGGYKEALEAVVERLLFSPYFLNVVEVEGTPVNGREDLLQLGPYELATRLSYLLQNDMPNPAVMKAAKDGSIMTDAGYDAVVQSLYTGGNNGGQRVRKTAQAGDELHTWWPYQNYYSGHQIQIDGFFREWLKLYDNPGIAYSNQKLTALSEYGRSQPTYLADDHFRHYLDMQMEVFNLLGYFTWNVKGKYADMMTTDKVFYTGDARRLYDVAPWAPGTDPPWKSTVAPPSYPPGQRDGLLLRGLFMLSGDEVTNPVRRGVFVQRQILCRRLPSPDPDALPDRALDPPEAMPSLTTRDRYANKTAAAQCQACHQYINPTGFALEGFDSLGRRRATELVFKDGSTKVVGTPAVDTTARVPLDDTSSADVPGASELMRAIAGSKAGNECFVRQYFRFAFQRAEQKGDGCMLTDMYRNSTTKSMNDMFVGVTAHPHFKLRKIRF